jgi:hypothetical protein
VAGSLQVGPLAETPAAALVLLPFLAVGIVGLGTRLRQAGPVSPSGMLAVWLVGYYVAIVLVLGLKYPRYFMPTTLLAMPVVALGLVLVGQAIWRRLLRTWRVPA